MLGAIGPGVAGASPSGFGMRLVASQHRRDAGAGRTAFWAGMALFLLPVVRLVIELRPSLLRESFLCCCFANAD